MSIDKNPLRPFSGANDNKELDNRILRLETLLIQRDLELVGIFGKRPQEISLKIKNGTASKREKAELFALREFPELEEARPLVIKEYLSELDNSQSPLTIDERAKLCSMRWFPEKDNKRARFLMYREALFTYHLSAGVNPERKHYLSKSEEAELVKFKYQREILLQRKMYSKLYS